MGRSVAGRYAQQFNDAEPYPVRMHLRRAVSGHQPAYCWFEYS